MFFYLFPWVCVCVLRELGSRYIICQVSNSESSKQSEFGILIAEYVCWFFILTLSTNQDHSYKIKTHKSCTRAAQELQCTLSLSLSLQI